MNTTIRLMTVLFLVAALSCDEAPGGATSAASTDCLIGMFKPEGLTDCVFPAETSVGDPATVSDNRCATGQPAYPPACVSDTGRRSYLSASHTCAANYHFEPGVCERNSTGGTGFAGTTSVPDPGGFTGEGGTTQTGDFATGSAGSTDPGTGTGGVTGAAGCAGACTN
jgi:hypothetical protein